MHLHGCPDAHANIAISKGNGRHGCRHTGNGGVAAHGAADLHAKELCALGVVGDLCAGEVRAHAVTARELHASHRCGEERGLCARRTRTGKGGERLLTPLPPLATSTLARRAAADRAPGVRTPCQRGKGAPCVDGFAGEPHAPPPLSSIHPSSNVIFSLSMHGSSMRHIFSNVLGVCCNQSLCDITYVTVIIWTC